MTERRMTKTIFQDYDPQTGAIFCTRMMTQEVADCMKRDFNVCLLEGAGDNSTHYVDITKTPHEIALKHAQKTTQSAMQIVADGEDTLILDNLPVPCKVSIGNETYAVNDGSLEWSTLLQGTYPIRVTAVYYVDWKGEVKAT